MDNLYEFMKRYKCNYSNDKDLKKAIIKAKSKEELEKYLQDEGTFVDCGMSTTGLVILYLHSLVENESDIRNIEDLLKDPTNPEENFYTIPTDGIVEKNMLIRILPKNNIENSDLKIRYFRTNYLQDKLLPPVPRTGPWHRLGPHRAPLRRPGSTNGLLQAGGLHKAATVTPRWRLVIRAARRRLSRSTTPIHGARRLPDAD